MRGLLVFAAASLAWLCLAPAFAAEPKLADDPHQPHRYNAACAAALAAASQGEDAARLPDKLRDGLRRQALRWLSDDLAAWRKLLTGGGAQARQALAQHLRHSQKDPDLAPVRDAAALAALPDAECAAWEKLWADVADLLKKAQDSP